MWKILVAEDDSASRELLAEIFQRGGCQVVEACDGREALQKAEEIHPDLVLLDLQMPRLDGFTVLRQLRQNPCLAALPVLALTAYAMQGDREKVLAAGFDGYIAKPIDAAALKTQIEQFLD
ncbi:MAG: response regulator [Terriglobia bacterium]